MQIHFEGRARVVGDDVNTDYIISSTRKKESLDPQVLKTFLFEALDSSFAASVRTGDVLVAGKNFGCGSAMEIAVSILLSAGFKAVLAQSFARTFYRNAINNGLVPVECDTSGVKEGDGLIVDLTESAVSAVNKATGQELIGNPFPAIMLEILEAGGLVPYFRMHHDFRDGWERGRPRPH
jgi:3-isopropylmalate/(R)-2-methylmalate dehydratase small subunit